MLPYSKSENISPIVCTLLIGFEATTRISDDCRLPFYITGANRRKSDCHQVVASHALDGPRLSPSLIRLGGVFVVISLVSRAPHHLLAIIGMLLCMTRDCVMICGTSFLLAALISLL